MKGASLEGRKNNCQLSQSLRQRMRTRGGKISRGGKCTESQRYLREVVGAGWKENKRKKALKRPGDGAVLWTVISFIA